MKMTEGAESGEAGLLVEIGAGQKDRGREQLVREMWLGSIRELHPGRGRYKSMLASRREQWELVRNVTGYRVIRDRRPPHHCSKCRMGGRMAES
jgi:hypothetical protein